MTIERGRELVAQAKERIRGRRAIGFFNAAFQELNRAPNDGMEWFRRSPPVWLLIAKWALASWRPNDDRPEPTREDIGFVAQTMWDALGELQAVEGQPAIFMRRMAHQQLWFQRRFDTSSIPRQFRILGELMGESVAAARFRDRYGLSFQEFVVQLAHIAADAGDNLGLPAVTMLRPATARNPDHWQAVRRILNRNVPALHGEMAELAARNTPSEVEVCELTPLVRTPLLEERNHGPVCIHHQLLFRCLESVAFDLGRAIDARGFMNDFGPAFENYVAEVLADLGGDLIRENDLAGRLLGEGQVVDFALVSDDAIVLIDAKGIEGHYDELYHNQPEELSARFRTSLLRAVDQAISTTSRLPAELRRPEVFFLCVTFKQVVVTDGTTLRALTNGTPEWESERWQSEVLTPARIFFPAIYELESMVALATDTRTPLSHLLREFFVDNGQPLTRKLLLEQHVTARTAALDAPMVVQEAAERLRR